MSAEHEKSRQYDRHPRRIACSFEMAGGTQRAFITNISARGFFVETRSRLAPGEEIVVTIDFEWDSPIVVTGAIARTRRPPRSIAMIEKSGVGVEVLTAPEGYYLMVLEFEE